MDLGGSLLKEPGKACVNMAIDPQEAPFLAESCTKGHGCEGKSQKCGCLVKFAYQESELAAFPHFAN